MTTTARPRGRRLQALRHAVALRVQAGEPCSICGEPIDLALKYPHPMSMVLDHYVPIVAGGHPTDERNHRPAHNRCNGRKGASVPTPKRSRQW